MASIKNGFHYSWPKRNNSLISVLPGPGRAVPVLKVEEFSWKDEQEHEPETEIPANAISLEINGEAVHSGPVGTFTRSSAAYHLALWRRT